MALIHLHNTGGCQAVVREADDGLNRFEIHRYLCGQPPKFRVYLAGDMVKLSCLEHFELWSKQGGFLESVFLSGRVGG